MRERAKKRIHIDDDIRAAAQAYVNAQLATMEKYGGAMALTPERYGQLVYDCAKPAQEIRNWKRKAPS